MTTLERTLDHAARLVPPYLLQLLPTESDERILDVMREVVRLDGSARTALVDRLTADQQTVLALFAERMATHAVRGNVQEAVGLGLAAVALIRDAGDIRDHVILLPLFIRAATALGLDWRGLFEQTAELAPTELAREIGRYAAAESPPSIEAMGYREEGKGPTFRFARRW